MKFHSRLLGRVTKIVLPDLPGEPVAEAVILEFTIQCEICGEYTVKLAGHHLRALRNLIIETIDLHPTLCGEESGIDVVHRLQFEGTPPRDPETN